MSSKPDLRSQKLTIPIKFNQVFLQSNFRGIHYRKTDSKRIDSSLIKMLRKNQGN